MRGTPFYYQFKLTEYLSRSTAAERLDGTYNGPYFRIKLHRRENNRQHRLLWALGQQNPYTYYVAPEVKAHDHFNDAFLSRTIVQKSRMIPLSNCEELIERDARQHAITFIEGEEGSMFHSAAKRIERTYRGRNLRELCESTRPRWRVVDKSFAKDLLDQTIEAVRRIEDAENERAIITQRHLMDEPIAGLPRTEVLQRIANIAATVFGATMVMVGARPTP